MNDTERTTLIDLRRALLHLHKTMLDWERAAFERIHGRLSGSDLLKAILNDDQFAWLRPMSGLIVRIDEALEENPPDVPADVDAIVTQARRVTLPDEAGSAYARRYHAALQEHPDAVLAHRDLMAVLTRHGNQTRPPA